MQQIVESENLKMSLRHGLTENAVQMKQILGF